jgi:hypothetical protein
MKTGATRISLRTGFGRKSTKIKQAFAASQGAILLKSVKNVKGKG